jgi:uncharacterized protein YkwD
MFAAAKPSHLRRIAAAAVATAALVAPSQALAAGCPDEDANPNSIGVAKATAATLCLLNNERRARGLRPLKLNEKLSLAARRHARAMAARNFFAHGDFVGRIRAAKYLSGAHSWTVGENIAWGSWDYATPASIHEGWMNSPPHKKNILSSRFREVGIGVAEGAPVGGQRFGATYATDFGSRG